MVVHLEMLHKAFDGCDAFKDACVLVKVGLPLGLVAVDARKHTDAKGTGACDGLASGGHCVREEDACLL